MRKAELLKLPQLKPTKEILEVAKNDIPEIEKCYGNYSREIYKFQNYYRATIAKDILKVGIFSRDDLLREKPSFEIYISKKENRYLTYDTIGEKWKTAKIDRLFGDYYCSRSRYYTKGTENIITTYLNNGYERGYEAIYQFQEEIASNNLKRTHRKITDRIDSAMELVPDLPKNFMEWCEEIGMIHSRYIYYNYSRNVKEGYCTHCKQTVAIESPKHNLEGKCSNCKSDITFKAIKKAALVGDTGYVTILQKTKEGFILRYFSMQKSYRDYKIPTFTIRESIRTIYNKAFEATGKYEWADFKNTGEVRWCDWQEKNWAYSCYRSYGTYEVESILYVKNLKRVLKGTEFQYSAIELFAKKIIPYRFYPTAYLTEYKRNKGLEYIVKLGLYKVAKAMLRGYDSSEINRHGRRVQDVLKVQKEQVPMLMKMDPDLDELRVLQKANAAGVKVSSEQIKWIAKYLGRSDLIGYMKFSTPHKIIRHLTEKFTGKNLKNAANDYCDYLESCEKLGYDLKNEFILFPKNFKYAHDLATKEWQEKKERIDNMQEDEKNVVMQEIAEELVQEYAFKDKHFSIRIPWTCEDIKKEGHDLHHCVGNYVDRVLRKETVILCIRRLEDLEKPFYTMEVKKREVIQVRGKNNRDATEEVEKFVEKFKVKILDKIAERIAS